MNPDRSREMDRTEVRDMILEGGKFIEIHISI